MATALNIFSRQETNIVEEIQESPRANDPSALLASSPENSAEYLKMVLTDRLIEPIVHTHQFKGKKKKRINRS